MDYKGGNTLIPNMKFYVISIVAIFAALGIGVYIGFTLDTNSFIVEQKEDIATKLEERFDFLKSENQEIKKELKEIDKENDEYKYFISSTYEEIIKGRLEGMKIAIIETKSDYMYSGIGQVLDIANASITSITTLNDKIMDEEMLNTIYDDLDIPVPTDGIIPNSIKELTESLIVGEETKLIKKLIENNSVDIVGDTNQPIDYIIIAGGSIKEDKKRLSLVDQTIINMAKDKDMPLVGIEKLVVNYSYIPTYKNLKISTIDNVDTLIGKISLILTIEGRPGHYGSKPTAEELFPNLNTPTLKSSKER